MSRDIDAPIATYEVLIVGGGNAGISTAARLIRKGFTEVAVVEPQSVHTYRPMLSYVGIGEVPLHRAERTQRSVTPAGCTWLEDSVVSIDPVAAIAHCASGTSYRYEHLVLAQGLVPDRDELPGIEEAINSPGVASNYLDHAEKTWDLVQSMPSGGRAVFTVPRPPVSCTGTTLKPMFLAASYWRRTGRSPGIDITLVIDRPGLLGVDGLDSVLQQQIDHYGIRVMYGTAVTELEPEARRVHVRGPGGTVEALSYDLLHLVPPYRGPSWVHEAGLAGDRPAGVVDIDPRTFRHVMHRNIWAVGDGAGVETDPSGGGLRQQVQTLVENMIAARSDKPLSDYDGYTVAPVAVGTRRLIAAEFDRDGSIQSSLPRFVDPLKPRVAAWAFDRYLLPQVYWLLILKGRA